MSSGNGNLPEVIVIGDSTRREFRGVLETARREAHLVSLADYESAVTYFAAQEAFPDLIVVLQTFSDCPLVTSCAELLWRMFPLAWKVEVLGSWAEGESRSLRAAAGILRVPWHQWCLVWRDFLRSYRKGMAGVGSLSADCFAGGVGVLDSKLLGAKYWLRGDCCLWKRRLFLAQRRPRQLGPGGPQKRLP